VIGLALLLALGLALIATSAHLLHEPTENEPSGVSWMDALIFLLCLAGILAQRAKRDDEDD
jgi:hypothetical protein